MHAALTNQVLAVILASLRLVPLFGFTQPFTLIKVPATARAALVLALAACLPGAAGAVPNTDGGLIAAGTSELVLGIAMALPLQLAFGMIATAGRALDIQAGFGLAFLVDPKTKAQMPLIGALFTYASVAVFFLTSGPADLVAVIAASFVNFPIGAPTVLIDPAALIGFLGTVSVLALGLVGLAVTVLFLIDLVIAMLSRTLPQMNVLVFGFQVKSFVTLVILPVTIGYAGAGITAIVRLAIVQTPRMI